MSNRHRFSWGLSPARRPNGTRTLRNTRLNVERLDGRILPSASIQQLDFGTYASYNQPGFARVTPQNTYSSATGYGWLSGNVASADYGSVLKDDLSFNVTRDATFGVALPSGTYVVTVSAHDPNTLHDKMGVSLEGQLRGWLTLERDLHEVRASYTVSVTDGLLNLRLHDLGGNGPFAIINSLVIEPTALPPHATFAGTGTTEGSPGLVTFSNPAGGVGPYTYNVDFNNDGIFEVVAGSNAAVTVPATYLADGPSARIVRGRITGANGLFSEYATSVAIANAPPSVTLAAALAGTTAGPVAFSATVTDPSPVDMAAGFTYNWDFGDGTSGTQAGANHTYTTAGTYTARLTVRDKDGGLTTRTSTVTITQQAQPGAIIVTGYDRIPNFGAQPTIASARSGLWSDPGTWSANRVPTAGDVVSITAGNDVTYDIVSAEAIKTVAVQANGRLVFRTDVDTRLTVINLLVMGGGELRIGTAANPVAANVKAEVVFADVALDLVNDPAQYGNGLIALGRVTVHGAVKADTFVRLAADAAAGATTLTLATPVTGWRVGDRLLLPDARQLAYNERGSSFAGQWEMVTLAAISADGRTLTLSQPLAFSHRGSRTDAGVVEFLPHVGNLTRNVVFRSQNASGTRGHTLFTARAEVDIRYAQFAGLGRTRITPLDNTTFNASGAATHFGTNQQGRYSVNFHHLAGPTTAPSNGYQFTFAGNAVFCPILPMPFRWGIALNDSHYGLVKDNVLYNWAGGGIVGESGSESYNVVEHNYVVRTLAETNTVDTPWLRADRRPLGDFATEGVGLWFRGFNNYVRNNVATGATSYGYTYFAQYAGAVRVPAFQGADTSVAGQYQTVNANATPILQFENNEAYGAMPAGLTIWWLGTTYHTPHNVAQSVVKDLRVWHAHEQGYFGYESNRLVLDGLVVRGNYGQLNGGTMGKGIDSADYFQKDFVVRNADIRGMYIGFAPSHDSGGGTQTIENSYLRNYYNIFVGLMWTSWYRSDLIPARLTVVRNVTFDTPAVPDTGSWGPKYDFFTSAAPAGVVNYVRLDELMVYDYDGVAGDNFQVYYTEQRPDYVLPQSTYNGDGTTIVTASPTAGLTNAQAWVAHQVAFAGAVAPTSATRAKVRGFVRAF